MRIFSVSSGKYVWVEKGINQKGSKEFWIPRNKHQFIFADVLRDQMLTL